MFKDKILLNYCTTTPVLNFKRLLDSHVDIIMIHENFKKNIGIFNLSMMIFIKIKCILYHFNKKKNPISMKKRLQMRKT